MLLMLHQLHTYNNTLYLIFGRGDKTWTCDLTVTFGDPVATSFKTSFEELAPLQNATSISHPSVALGDRYQLMVYRRKPLSAFARF